MSIVLRWKAKFEQLAAKIKRSVQKRKENFKHKRVVKQKENNCKTNLLVCLENAYKGDRKINDSMLKSQDKTCLHKHIFIENDIVFNENTTIVLHLRNVFVSFFISFSAVYTKTETIENGKSQRESIVCVSR